MSVKSEQKKRARRKPLRGYPIEIPFSNMDDVREYTSGERVVCLLCGREFKKLGAHIEKIYAPRAGLIIGVSTLPLVHEGEAIFHLAHLSQSDTIGNLEPQHEIEPEAEPKIEPVVAH